MTATRDRGVLPDDVPVGATLDLNCPDCGQPFQWTSQPDHQWAPSYCSKACRRRANRRRQPQRRTLLDESTQAEENGEELRLLVCERCWLPFAWTPPTDPVDAARADPPAYHSVSCREKARKERAKERVRRSQEDRAARREARALSAAEEERRRAEEEHAARVAAEAAAARELLLPASRCSNCGKVANPTEQAAKASKRAIEARAGRTNAVRYYQCYPGGPWHWTRMDADLDGWRSRRETA